MSRALAPKGGNDDVQTPPVLARLIVRHFNPQGPYMLEPCSGDGNFLAALRDNARPGTIVDYCEIKKGRDFFSLKPFSFGSKNACDWIVTNPPWSQFRAFLRHSMALSENIIFLSLVNAWFMRARVRDMWFFGFGIREILYVDTPPPPWPQAGFQLGAVWIQRGYRGPVTITDKTTK